MSTDLRKPAGAHSLAGRVVHATAGPARAAEKRTRNGVSRGPARYPFPAVEAQVPAGTGGIQVHEGRRT